MMKILISCVPCYPKLPLFPNFKTFQFVSLIVPLKSFVHPWVGYNVSHEVSHQRLEIVQQGTAGYQGSTRENNMADKIRKKVYFQLKRSLPGKCSRLYHFQQIR